jgi:hypothetical protein
MRKFPFSRRAGWVLGILVLVTAGGILALRTERLPSIQLADGSVLSVVAVEVGTNSVYPLEPRWRHYLRRVCPNQWEVALLGKTPNAPVIRTRHDSLLLWIRQRGADGKPTTDRQWVRVLIRPSEGNEDDAIPAAFGSSLGVACLEFRTYPRDAKRVPLKLWNGANDVPIEVINPRPVSAARWQAGPLPQTNRFLGSDIILRPLRMYGVHGPTYVDARFSVRSGGAEQAGWMEWYVTVMDPWGNWSEAGWPLKSPRPLLKISGLRGEVWRIQADGVEYLSAGFVPPLTNGSAVVIPVGARAKEFGVRFLVAVGAGEYQVRDGGATYVAEEEVATLPRAQMSVTSSTPGSWQLTLRAPYPGVLCVTEEASQHKARLRVRPGRMEGQNIWTSELWRGEGTSQRFHFFSRHLPAVAREELEAEVFSPLPPVEYFIPSPPSPEWDASESNSTP